MKLILTHDVTSLGAPGDIVEVKDGYGRNYLVPKGLAIAWSSGAEKQIVQIKRLRQVREVRDLGHAKELKAELEALQVKVASKAGETGHLFGSVGPKDVALAIKKAGGPDVERTRIEIADPIKNVGTYTVSIKLHAEVVAAVPVAVVAES